MLAESVKNMTRRSIPRPNPPVGGKPYSSLRTSLKKGRPIRMSVNKKSRFENDLHAKASFLRSYSRVHEGLVDTLSLVVSLVLLPCLLLEPLSLVERIVQLGVGVADLLGSDESLEPFAKTRSGSMTLGQRRHDLRVSDDERGVDALVLDELADEL
jgi:hypothetical protein